ncbi:MAG: ATP-binding cassette domain-containing protein, partial [Pseudomonadota bacterium]
VEAHLVWAGGRRLLARLGPGACAFALAADALPEIRLIASDDAVLRRISDTPDDIPEAADDWIRQALEFLELPEAPTDAVAEAEALVGVRQGGVIASPSAVYWLKPGPNTALALADTPLRASGPQRVCVFGPLWVRVESDGEIAARRSRDLVGAQLCAAVAGFNADLAALFDVVEARADATHLARLRQDPRSVDLDGSPIGRALMDAATALKIDIRTMPTLPAAAETMAVPALARIGGLRARKIALEAGWQRRDQGPIIAYTAGDGKPIALLWDGTRYRADGEGIGARDVERFQHTAFVIHAGLPQEVTGLWSLAWHIIRVGNQRDAVRASLAAAGIALVGILIPIATAWLLSEIVPAGIAGRLIAVGIALGCGTLVTFLLSAARTMSTSRIEGRGATALGAAVTDRLLRLPVRFFKDFSAGDLNQRIENVEQMRALAVSIIMSAGLTAVLSFVYLGVLLAYDTRLALIAVGLVIWYILAVGITRALQQGALREGARLDGEIAGLTYETLEGVAKLRAAAAEERAMARWAKLYREEREVGVRAGRVGTNFGAFADAYQTITIMTLFAGASILIANDTSAGMFIGFLAAFGSFQGAFVGLSEALLQIYSAQPLVERAKPLLGAEPEVAPGRADPGVLKGAIEGTGLTFSYGDGLPAVLTDLSFDVRPGEHMAIVGGSGSGKSTLLRLLLGFENPQRGSILYDGQDLSRLDLTRVRGQIGVVLQASQLFAGSILENIRGATNTPLEQCLHAARDAGLETDLQYFAMGIHTPITEGASTLSGGQRQRILIARALAARPNILFFDEATSALDNQTQAVVSETLDRLAVTRITIAHRLSTVRHADRICVLERGRFVEQGTFDTLMAADGAFAQLAARQLTET